MNQRRVAFSTRDLLMMATLAALGGVTSTYINAIGDFFQSIFGFAGTTQWAAGLHVLWLTLAVGLTGKQGTGTITGLLKGGVELLSGNTHGLLVVLVDIVAGLLVDLGFLPFRKKDSLLPYLVAGGLASASNVFIFKLFASLPADVLAYGAMLLVGGMAFVSGLLFAGLLAWLLLNALRRAGVVKDRAPQTMNRRLTLAFLAVAVVLMAAFGVYLRQALQGPATIHVGGAVAAPYVYPSEHGDIAEITAEAALRGASSRYTGISVKELIARAEPQSNADLLLIKASDGYAFFVSMEEVQENEALLLVCQGEGDDASCNVVGPENSKAWVRGVSELTVIGSATLEVTGALGNSSTYNPDEWQFKMDSTRLDVGDGVKKYQGAPLGQVLASMSPDSETTTIVLHTEGEPVTVPLVDALTGDDLRLFTVIGSEKVTFAVAWMNGQVVAPQVTRIEVK